jgi:hypothetical protein
MVARWLADDSGSLRDNYESRAEPHDPDAALDALGLLTWPMTPRALAWAYRRAGGALAELDYRSAPSRNHRARAAADARGANHSRDELAKCGLARMTATGPTVETLPGCSAATAARASAFA